MTNAKLPRTQQELLDALRSGVVCHYMPYSGRFNPAAYWFRGDNMKRCTAAAEALIAKGFAETFDDSWRGAKLRPKQEQEQEDAF